MHYYVKCFNEIVTSQPPMEFRGRQIFPWTQANITAKDQSSTASQIAISALKMLAERPADTVGKCFGAVQAVSSQLLAAKIKHIVTVGDVILNGKAYFGATPQGLQREMEEGCDAPSPVLAHAWITLENGVVMDLTIKSSFAARVSKKPLKWNEAVFLSSKNSLGAKHVPMMVGAEYQMRAIIEQEVWAQNFAATWAEEMHQLLHDHKNA